ncbi:MOSC domain-containing protein [Actinocorallia longicatena]|uniref:MOSC domain-containing protein n=1 Tax=Actinocorallia longicatena TaxID=111803 RepID=A0ABP6QI65_9ACTN
MGIVVSVNVGRVRDVEWGPSAIDKRPVAGPVAINELGLDGDEQADRRNHGGPDQAVYAYAREDLDHFEGELGRELRDGRFGENLTLRGVDVNGALLGERWRVGGALLEVRSPRVPCGKFKAWLDERGWVKRFAAEGRPGAYFRVLETGTIGAGDSVEIVDRPDGGVTVAESLRAYYGDRELLRRIVALERRSAKWDAVAEHYGA